MLPSCPCRGCPAPTSPVVAGDPILRAMKDELERTQTMKLAGYSPYYIEYYTEDGHSFKRQCEPRSDYWLGIRAQPYSANPHPRGRLQVRQLELPVQRLLRRNTLRSRDLADR